MTWDEVGTDDTLEARAAVLLGLEPLAEVQAKRAEKVREAAPLRALRDVFDAKRKSQRGLVTARIVAEYGAANKKLPAAETLEMIASADPAYTTFLDNAESAFLRLAILEDEIAALTERVNRDQRLLQWATVERYST